MKVMTLCLVIASSVASVVLAQEAHVPTFRLNFRIHESGAQAEETTRNYVLVVQSESRGKINASRRLPHYTKSQGEAKELHLVAAHRRCRSRIALTRVRLRQPTCRK